MEATTAGAAAQSGRPRRIPIALASEARLVALARAGDRNAFARLYDRHHHDLLGFCRHMLGSLEDAEDVVQQAFAKAWSELPRRPDLRELRPWLFVVARHACVDVLRARQPSAELDETVPALAGLTDQVAQRSELRELLADLQRLPERQRAGLLLAELGGLSHAQIAATLDCRAEQVKALVFQARSTLMAERAARDASCGEIREQLSVLTGGALLRGPLRRHLRRCGACREFRDGLRAQRRDLALLLPVIPTVGLRAATLHRSFGPAGAAGAGGAGAASGGMLLFKGAGLKGVFAGLAGAGATVGAAVAIHGAVTHGGDAAAVRSKPANAPAVVRAQPSAQAPVGVAPARARRGLPPAARQRPAPPAVVNAPAAVTGAPALPLGPGPAVAVPQRAGAGTGSGNGHADRQTRPHPHGGAHPHRGAQPPGAGRPQRARPRKGHGRGGSSPAHRRRGGGAPGANAPARGGRSTGGKRNALGHGPAIVNTNADSNPAPDIAPAKGVAN